jgi:hypothetical protein
MLQVLGQQLHHQWSEHVHPEETEIITRPQARNDQALLGLSRRRFFQQLFHLIKTGPTWD